MNPILPLNEYIPDGEPHVFGDRVYLFGSHDKEAGETFCMKPYEFYSAPLDDLSNWTSKGINYEASQDPLYTEERCYMYAPDVVKGNDGKYYLYYSLSGAFGETGYFGPVSVAVADEPDGKYEYLGVVKDKEGKAFKRFVPFDPAVINDDGVIRLYYGTMYDFEEIRTPENTEELDEKQIKMFGKTKAEIHAEEDGVMGPVTMVLSDDMMTVISEPKRIMPVKVKGTEWEAHPFFEGSSIRKINGTYYFIYSSRQNHELCYATSEYPDRDFHFGGTIVSNGDVGYLGRKEEDRLNLTGTTHGSIEKIGDDWYVFYHRLTHGSDYSRQACAERITINEDGSIDQVEVTSLGLSKEPLSMKGTYPAVICCNLTNGHMPHSSNAKQSGIPMVASGNNERFITGIEDNVLIGYKYFNALGEFDLSIFYRGDGEGVFEISLGENEEKLFAIEVSPSENWKETECAHITASGKVPIYLKYKGKGLVELRDIIFK